MIDWIYLQAKNARIKNHVSRAHSEQAAQDMPWSQARSLIIRAGYRACGHRQEHWLCLHMFLPSFDPARIRREALWAEGGSEHWDSENLVTS